MTEPTAALLYAPEGYDTSRPKLMGRHAAGEGFLGAMVRHAGFDRMLGLVRSAADGEAFARQVAALGGRMPCESLLEAELHRLAGPGALMLPGPDVSGYAWRRRRTGEANAFSVVGVTHTTASATAMDSIADLLVAPVQPWDALICTSMAVQGMVRRVLEAEGAYLARRLGATRLAGPALPVIPLGVDAAALAAQGTARTHWRGKLGLGARDVAVLHHGRLSFHAKAHPLPMFLGLARAAAAAPKGVRVHLVLSGWFADDVQRNAFLAQAKALAPHLIVHHVDGRQPQVRSGIWSAMDAFTLLSDNVQETFGLAPVEAMAAGLPVVATDWDGLRETVEHGVTGFCMPTLMAGPMTDLAAAHAGGQDSYDSYIAGVAQFTAVDVAATEAAFAALIADPARRRAMGEAGRKRVLRLFDWAPVMRQYLELWAELGRIRRDGRGERAAPLRGEERVPRRPDPSLVFADYPTRRLAPETRLVLAPDIADAAAAMARLASLAALTGVAMRRDLLPGEDSFRLAFERLAQGPASAAQLTAELPPARAMRLHRALAWLAKLDLVRLES
jgi:glycosyltransferase involved in cell wall biosynthesis